MTRLAKTRLSHSLVKCGNAAERYLQLLGCSNEPKLREAREWVTTWLGTGHPDVVAFFGPGWEKKRALS